MPAELTFRYRSPYFKHVFGSDGYASGYYTYLWAEVLDTDGFELFKEKAYSTPPPPRLSAKTCSKKAALSTRWNSTSTSAARNPLSTPFCATVASTMPLSTLKTPKRRNNHGKIQSNPSQTLR